MEILKPNFLSVNSYSHAHFTKNWQHVEILRKLLSVYRILYLNSISKNNLINEYKLNTARKLFQFINWEVLE